MKVHLGQIEGEDASLNVKTFRRHMVCLGASGSGKTVSCKVLCEEFIRNDIPIIALDPQGDIASLALSISPEEAEKHGLSPEAAREYREKADVRIWTPASSLGLPLSVNPLGILNSNGKSQNYEEFLREISLTADTIASLLGYDLSKDDGRLTSGILNLALTWISEQNTEVKNFTDLADFLNQAPDEFQEKVATIASSRELNNLAKKLRLLTVGKGKLMFELGHPLDIESLLGVGDQKTPGKTRLSIIYLNTLSSMEEKAFFLAQIATSLYEWMLDNPHEGVQALFYIDEVAPFLPPVRKPACKDILKLLFKQARKYGISCLIASQNPGDIDYTALAQCSTWNLGRMLTSQDIKKVEKMLKSLAPESSEEVADRLPSLEPGRFLLFSPDEFDQIVEMQVRWLLTEHRTLDEDAIRKLVSDDLRQSYLNGHQPKVTTSPEEVAQEEIRTEIEESEKGEEEEDMLVIVDDEDRVVADKILGLLYEEQSAFTTSEMADLLDVSTSTIRRHLKDLDSEIKETKVGRSYHYWHSDYALLPQYGLTSPVEVAKLQILEQEALHKAEREINKKLFIIETEDVHALHLRHLPLWQVYFTETLKTRHLLIFTRESEEEENIYFHGITGEICLYQRGKGFSFVETPRQKPSQLMDLDDVCTFESRLPGELEVDKKQWKNLLDREEIEKKVARKFRIEVHQLALTFLPLWEIHLREKKGGKKRNIYLDGVVGHVIADLNF